MQTACPHKGVLPLETTLRALYRLYQIINSLRLLLQYTETPYESQELVYFTLSDIKGANKSKETVWER